MKIEYLPSAWEDLKRIEDWYLMRFDEKTAIKVTTAIVRAVSRLADHPDSGSLTPSEWANAMGFRMVIQKRHVAFYKINGDTVYIHHIADAKQDYAKLFSADI